MFPIIKLGYRRSISEVKLAILQAIHKSGDSLESLEELVDVTGFN